MRVSSSAWRPRAAWVVSLTVVVTGMAFALAIPQWGRHRVRTELVERLAQKTGLDVTVEDIEIGWGRAALSNLRLRGADEGPRFEFTTIVASFERASAWSTEVVVGDVTVVGGTIEASIAQLADLRDRNGPVTPSAASSENTALVSRARWLPARLRVADVALSLVDDGRGLAVDGTLDLDAEFAGDTPKVSVGLRRVTLQAGDVTRASIAELRSDVALVGVRPEFPVRVEFSGASAPLRRHLAVAGVEGWIELSDAALSEVRVDVGGGFGDVEDAALASPRLWSVAGALRRDLTAGRIRVDMDAFELGRVPAVLERLPLHESERATVGGNVAVVFSEGLARAEGSVALAGVNLNHPTLARTVVRDVGFDLGFAVEIDPQSRRLEIVSAELERQGVKLELTGSIEHPARREGRKYDLSAQIPVVSCAEVLDAIPDELVPALEKFGLRGAFDARVDVDIDYANLEGLTMEGKVGIDGCRVRSTPPHADPRRLAGGFTHRVQLRNGESRELELYTGSRDFTPFSEISPYMVQAVLTTEDGGFWRHHGFLPSQFEVALRRNLMADQIKLGASTITMQMVKNVLLSHERTLSRKLQEMFLTWYVETAISKERILELYLNAIEYAPSVYGITHAARHYYGKRPADLTPPEAAYLALMLPSPVRRHVHYCKGQLSEAFRIKLQRILGIMHQRERLTDLEYEVWKDTPLVFDLSERASERACLARIEALSAGTYTQRALSGLLGAEPVNESSRPASSRRVIDEDDDEPFDAADVDAPGAPAMDEFEF